MMIKRRSKVTHLGWYWVLLAAQTVGAAVITWNGLPIYRELVEVPSKHVAQASTLVWSGSMAVVIQISFWLCRRHFPTLPHTGSVFFGNVLLFLSRLCFILATSTFSVVFILRPEQLMIPPLNCMMLLVVLFSVFCYTQELERLGRAVQAKATS